MSTTGDDLRVSGPVFEPDPLVELLEVLGDDGPPVVADIVTTYLDDVGGLLDDLHRPAGLDPEGREVVCRAAHTLKSASASVGAQQLSSIGRAVEEALRGGDVETATEYLPVPSELVAATRVALEDWLTVVTG